MKKVFFFLTAGIMGLTACTSEDVVNESVQANAIGFQNLVTKESRAITNGEFSNFYVYGYYTKGNNDLSVVSVFNDVLVSRTGSDATWGYSDPRYWVPEAKYFFYAYSCDNQATLNNTASFNIGGDDTADRALKLNNYRCDYSHNHDLVFALNEGETGTGIVGLQTGNLPVSFSFSHVLSRVRVTFKSDFAAGYQVEISNVKLQEIYNQADFTCKPYTWSDYKIVDDDNYLNFTIPSGKNIAKAGVPAVGVETDADYVAAIPAVNVETAAGYVIPKDYKDDASVELVFNMLLKDKDGNTVYGKQITGSWNPNWELGKSYNYNIILSGAEAGLEEIKFTASQVIGGWPDSDSEVGTDKDANDISIDMSFSAN